MPLLELLTLPTNRRLASEIHTAVSFYITPDNPLQVVLPANDSRRDLVQRILNWYGNVPSNWLTIDVQFMRRLVQAFGEHVARNGADEKTLTRLSYILHTLDRALRQTPPVDKPYWYDFISGIDIERLLANDPVQTPIQKRDRLGLVGVLVDVLGDAPLLDALAVTHVEAKRLHELLDDLTFEQTTPETLRVALAPDDQDIMRRLFAGIAKIAPTHRYTSILPDAELERLCRAFA